MFTLIRSVFMFLLLFTILTGLIYPVTVTVIAQAIFPNHANGSIITKKGKPVGSALIGQQFEDPKYFWGRLSATSPYPYNGASSSGSNRGPSNPALMQAVQSRISAMHVADPSNQQRIPVDLVTTSGSGLDPHISSVAAEYQAQRVARIRGIDKDMVLALIVAYSNQRQFGILGEPTVNVLKLNLALDELHHKINRGDNKT
jgi:K+-transporting ATPase ATPase C chain